ncbi:MAG: UPF0147 family protein [Nanoarchaeota archaeon]
MGATTEQLSQAGAVITNLNEIRGDGSVPRNVRMKIDLILNTLREDTELPIKVNKALNDLDELSNDINLQPYTRTLIWNIMSELEKSS